MSKRFYRIHSFMVHVTMFHVNLLELLHDWKQLSKHFHQMILYRNGCYGLTRTELDSNPGIHSDICNQPDNQVPGALIGIRLLSCFMYVFDVVFHVRVRRCSGYTCLG